MITIKLNIGCSNNKNKISLEEKKIEEAERYKVDYISNVCTMNFSKFDTMLKCHFDKIKVICLPMYEACETDKSPIDILREKFSMGYAGSTIHFSKPDSIEKFVQNKGILNSRGGFYARKYKDTQTYISSEEGINSVISLYKEFPGKKLFLGTMFRNGKVTYDYSSYIEEVKYIKSLYERFTSEGIDTELEFGGHFIIDDKFLSSFSFLSGVHLCVMGPLQTDATNGFDNANAMIGTYEMTKHFNVSTACIITPAEHLRFPLLKDTIEGLNTYATLREVVNRESQNNKECTSFATCNSLKTAIINEEKSMRGPIVNCGMCGKGQCPLYNNYYIPIDKVENFVSSKLKGRDIILIGGPFTGKTFISDKIMKTDNYNYIGFGKYARSHGYSLIKKLSNEELKSIFDSSYIEGKLTIVDNVVKNEENFEILNYIINRLNNPVIIYVKRNYENLNLSSRKEREDDKLTLKDKIFNWTTKVRVLVENYLCHTSIDTYIIENK